MKNEEIISVVKELINSSRTAINAETMASADMLKMELNSKMNTMIQHQERTNGIVDDNKKKIEKIECQTRFIRWFARNPALGISLIIILAFGIVFIISYFGLEFLFKI